MRGHLVCVKFDSANPPQKSCKAATKVAQIRGKSGTDPGQSWDRRPDCDACRYAYRDGCRYGRRYSKRGALSASRSRLWFGGASAHRPDSLPPPADNELAAFETQSLTYECAGTFVSAACVLQVHGICRTQLPSRAPDVLLIERPSEALEAFVTEAIDNLAETRLIAAAASNAGEHAPTPFTEAEGARRLGVSKATLQRERKRGRIRFMMIGGRPRYTLAFLAEYMASREVAPCAEADRSASGKSPATGSASGRAAPCGAGPGSTQLPAKLAEHHSALQIFGKPKSRSQSGSPAT
ncbi:helix-turn-helix domain-containing protein [Siccirubricoccus soli]|uniref:helix-turn-helix domain-containing protein n=1 Tax=Siccirubricoccus soli TaxID=2899147 RepID=UPI003515BDA9